MNIMPIRFNSLVIEFMTRCNAKCAICYQGAGPRGSMYIGDQYISPDVVERVINESPSVGGLGNRIHLSGGEAFIKEDELISHLEVAKSTDFFRGISVVTNAFWAAKRTRAAQVVQRCIDAGLTKMEISWDVWHKPYVDPIAIENAITACNKVGISTFLRILTTKSHSADEALSLLSDKTIDAADYVVSGPVAYIGRAKEVLSGEDIFPGSLNFKCHSVLNLVVNGGGDVFPCCAGADQTDGMCFGNVRNESIITIAQRMRNSPLLRSLAFGGISSFQKLLESNGMFLEDQPKAACQACFEIFGNSEMTSVIKDYFDAEMRRSMDRIAESTTMSCLGQSVQCD